MIGKIIALDWRATIMPYKLAYLLHPVLVFIFGFATSQMLVLPISVWLALSYSTNPFFAEEKGELNHLYLTLPVKRSQIVAARYVFSLILLVIGVAVGLVMTPVVRHFSHSRWYVGVQGNVALITVSALVFAIYSLFMFPPLFRLGYHRGKIFGFYIPAAIFGAVATGYYIYMLTSARNTTLDFIVFASENMLLVSGGITALAALIMLLSYRLSVRFYSQRNL